MYVAMFIELILFTQAERKDGPGMPPVTADSLHFPLPYFKEYGLLRVSPTCADLLRFGMFTNIAGLIRSKAEELLPLYGPHIMEKVQATSLEMPSVQTIPPGDVAPILVKGCMDVGTMDVFPW
jgi:hypothetical protein